MAAGTRDASMGNPNRSRPFLDLRTPATKPVTWVSQRPHHQTDRHATRRRRARSPGTPTPPTTRPPSGRDYPRAHLTTTAISEAAARARARAGWATATDESRKRRARHRRANARSRLASGRLRRASPDARLGRAAIVCEHGAWRSLGAGEAEAKRLVGQGARRSSRICAARLRQALDLLGRGLAAVAAGGACARLTVWVRCARTPSRISVHDRAVRPAGDMMVDGVIPLGGAVRPLGRWRPSTRTWRQDDAGSRPRCIGVSEGCARKTDFTRVAVPRRRARAGCGSCA